MQFLTFAITLPVLGALAQPYWLSHGWSSVSVVTQTVNMTATITDVLTKTFTVTASPSCPASSSFTTSSVYHITTTPTSSSFSSTKVSTTLSTSSTTPIISISSTTWATTKASTTSIIIPTTSSKPSTTTTKSSTSSTASSSTSSSAPASQPTAPYTVIAARSGSPIHLLSWTASNFLIHLGGSTASYCPVAEIGTACPAGTVTAFAGTCGMDVEVPGGQTLFITPSGALGYTQAHSAIIPTGSIECPLTYTPGPSYGDIGTNAFNATGFMACPVPASANTTAPYQVFAAFAGAQVPTAKVADCIGFDALSTYYSGVNGNVAAAWQYT